MLTNLYRIAELPVRISFEDSTENGVSLIPSLEPFRWNGEEGELFFWMHVDNHLSIISQDKCERIRDVDTGNGITSVDSLQDGGYQFLIRDVTGNACCLLQTDKDFQDCHCALRGNYGMRTFGLNNALMLIFAFAGSQRETLLIHASLVRNEGVGYAFTAKSGTGKSTHVNMWLQNIPNCDLMNDDNPIIRIQNGQAFIYGSPWSGKTPCYRNIKAPLGAITLIERAQSNFVTRNTTIEAFTTLLTACSTMKWDERLYSNICSLITKLIETVPNYTLHCLPNKEAALVCHKAIATK